MRAPSTRTQVAVLGGTLLALSRLHQGVHRASELSAEPERATGAAFRSWNLAESPP